MKSIKKHKKAKHILIKRILFTTVFIVALIALILFSYFIISYRNSVGVDKKAYSAALTDTTIQITQNQNYYMVASKNASNDVGLIVYGGAFSDPLGYISKLAALTQGGKITLFVVKSPFNFALLNQNAAAQIISQNPQIKQWYVAGHSVGGVAACNFASQNEKIISGLILLGSYCNGSIADSSFRVLDISASNDGLTTPQDVLASAKNLPTDTRFVELKGGNHSSFGDFAAQYDNDGPQTIQTATLNEQLLNTITKFVSGN